MREGTCARGSTSSNLRGEGWVMMAPCTGTSLANLLHILIFDLEPDLDSRYHTLDPVYSLGARMVASHCCAPH